MSKRYIKRWKPNKEYCLKRLVSQGMKGGIYEPTLTTSQHLSPCNVNAVLVDKVTEPNPTDEPRLTFDYSHVSEVRTGVQMELAQHVHDYLERPEHMTYL